MASTASTHSTEPPTSYESEPNTAKVETEPSTTYSAPVSGTIVFEDYLHYAALQRLEEEKTYNAQTTFASEKQNWFLGLSDHKGRNVNVDVRDAVFSNSIPMTADQEERATASRALRQAGWASIFYLITTDILGPFNAPYAISQVGWVPGTSYPCLKRGWSLKISSMSGIILYFFMGIIALYTGLILWRLFVRMDSIRYPVQTYADIAERIFGKWARYLVNVLQSLQLLVNVRFLSIS